MVVVVALVSFILAYELLGIEIDILCVKSLVHSVIFNPPSAIEVNRRDFGSERYALYFTYVRATPMLR